MTMQKLAELAGVSVSTVSKAFSGSREISLKRREYIFKIAKENGCYDKYCKNICPHPVIAVIYPEFRSRHYSEQLSVLGNEIRARGGIMIVGETDFNPQHTQDLLTFFTEYHKADGIIVLGFCTDIKYSVPIVSINGIDGLIKLSNKEAIFEAVQLFIENGHKKIGYIGERYTNEKCTHFKAALKKTGLKVNENYIICENNSRFEKAGYDAMNALFEQGNLPTAILAAYDCMAIGAMRSIHEHGKKIPQDISLIGMDNIVETEYLIPPLTTITSFNEDLCQMAAELIFEKIKNPNTKHKTIKVSEQLIKRNSVGKAPAE